jgi:hypothetical protein
MTLRELDDYVMAYNKRVQIENRKMYMLADMISGFSAMRQNGKNIPSFEDIFPPADALEEAKREEENNKRAFALLQAFAIGHNASRNKRGE